MKNAKTQCDDKLLQITHTLTGKLRCQLRATRVNFLASSRSALGPQRDKPVARRVQESRAPLLARSGTGICLGKGQVNSRPEATLAFGGVERCRTQVRTVVTTDSIGCRPVATTIMQTD